MDAGRKRLYWGKNYLPDPVALLFTDADLTVLASPTRNDDTDDSYTPEVFLYRSDVGSVRARLELQGFTSAAAFDIALSYLEGLRADSEEYAAYPQAASTYDSERNLLVALITWAQSSGRRTWPPTDTDRHLESVWEDLIECYDDPRFAIALLLHGTRANTSVRVDLSGCLTGGWLEPDERPHVMAASRLSSRTGSSGPIMVLTEGSTDAQFLSRALRLAAPAVAHQFTFLDFASTSSPGGVDQVERLTRSLAAAGIVNRVVAILDNDAVGNESKRRLDRLGLPSHFAVRVLPDVALARRYPTIGPNGAHEADVNGRAVTIEMSFGADPLIAGGNGQLPPVRWGGPVGKQQAYQGAIYYKAQVQSAIRTALDSVNSIADLVPGIAAACIALSRMLVEAASPALPLMASEYSPLLVERERAMSHRPQVHEHE